MEGEAGGQLGGMECSAEVRAKIAGESKGWRCDGCGGQSCEEILKESAERAKELEDAGVKVEEEVLPEGLKLGYKDEMKTEGGQEGEEDASPSAAAAEAPTPAAFTTSVPATPPPPLQQQPALPQYQPFAPPNLPAYAPGEVPAYLHPMYAPQPEPVVPRVETPWLDRFIWALVVALAALVARRYWGLELIA